MISNPKTLIRTSNANRIVPQKVIHRDVLPTKISQIEKIYGRELISDKELHKIKRQLKKHHTENDQPILKQFENFKGNDLEWSHLSSM